MVLLKHAQSEQCSNFFRRNFHEKVQLSGSVQKRAMALLKEKKAEMFLFISLLFSPMASRH